MVCLTLRFKHLQTYRQAQRNLRFTVLNGLLLHAFPPELHKFAGLGQEKPGKYMALKNIQILVFSHWQGSQSHQFCLGKQAKMRKEHLTDRKYASPLLCVNKDRSSCCCLLLHTIRVAQTIFALLNTLKSVVKCRIITYIHFQVFWAHDHRYWTSWEAYPQLTNKDYYYLTLLASSLEANGISTFTKK